MVGWGAQCLQPWHGVLRPGLTPTQNTGSNGALLEVGEPPQHPRAWAAAEGMVAEEEEEEEEKALGKDFQEELPRAEDLLLEPQEEQVHAPALQHQGGHAEHPKSLLGHSHITPGCPMLLPVPPPRAPWLGWDLSCSEHVGDPPSS